jgi:low temperature requirement protein LtrA
MSVFNFLGRPRTIDDQIDGRKISWLELFYDLIFAVVFSRITDGLVEHLSWTTILNATLIFWWFLWGWSETSGYFDNHGNGSILNVIIINVQMIFTGIGAIFIPEALHGNYTHLTIAFLLIELMLAAVWFGIAHYDRIHGPASRVWANVHLVSAGLLIISLFTPNRWSIAIIVLALIFNLGDVFFANPNLEREYQQTNMTHVVKDSLIERYGLMTMIALGEIIAGLYEAVAESGQSVALSQFIVCIILIALVSGSYYLILGELHITLSSSIKVIMTSWLFILDIFLIFGMGIALHLALDEATLTLKLAFSGLLFGSLLVMWAIEKIAVSGRGTGLSGILVILLTLLLLVAVAWLPMMWMLVAVDCIMGLVIVHERYLAHRDVITK